MRMLVITAALCALAACSPPAETTAETTVAEATTTSTGAPGTPAEATAQDTCGAAAYRQFIGQPATSLTPPPPAGTRIIPPDTPVTQDFRADRLNVLTDAAGVVLSLECY